MTIEELYGFGEQRSTQRFYQNHEHDYYYKIIQKHMVAKGSIAEYCNFSIPYPSTETLPYYKTLYPHHKALLQPEHQEGILCDNCDDTIYISRHIPRLSKELTLSNRFSTYHPKPLSSCRCGETSVIVSHKGIPHVYSDTEKFHLVTHFNNHQLRRNDFEFAELPKELNLRINPSKSRDRNQEVCGIYLKDLHSIAELGIIIPMSQSHSKSTAYTFITHLQRYAYTYKLLIYTRWYTFLPSGIWIDNYSDIAKAWLRAPVPVDIKMPKFSRDRKKGSMLSALAEDNNHYAEEFYRYLIDNLNLPEVPLSYYPKNTITYMHYVKPRSDSAYYVHRLKRLRRMVSRIARRVLLARNVQDIIQYTKDYYPSKPLAIPPKQIYFQNMSLHPKFFTETPLNFQVP